MPRIALLVLMLGATACCAQQGELQTVTRDGRAVATYYCVEPHMKIALDHMSDYFGDRDGSAFRVYEDRMMPMELRDLGYEPAEQLMRRWLPGFWAAQDPNTGLLPLEGPSRPREREAIIDQSLCMFMSTVDKATPFMEWFPEDAQVRTHLLALADGFIEHFRAGSGSHYGCYTAVRADTGLPEADRVNVTSYGSATAALARIGTTYGRDDLATHARGLAQWISDFSMLHTGGLIPETIFTGGGAVGDISSDGLYWIRALERAYTATGDEWYREAIIRHGEIYLRESWNADDQHFSTHVEFDRDGYHPARTMYGDTKYNYPSLLCLLTRLTGEPKYMELWDTLWATYMREAVNGWVPVRFEQGHRQEREGEQPEDLNQTIYLSLLLDAYETTGDGKYLDMADEWLQKLLTEDGRAHWRGDMTGETILRWLRHRGLITRLEVNLPDEAPHELSVMGAAGEELFRAQVPTQRAVLYLAPGQYEVHADGHSRGIELAAEQHATLTLTQ